MTARFVCCVRILWGVSADAEVNTLLQAGGGLVTRRNHLHLAGSFDWLLRSGDWLITEREGLRYSVPALTAIDMATFAPRLNRRLPVRE